MRLKKKVQAELVYPTQNKKRVMRLNYFLGNRAVLPVLTVALDILVLFLGSYLINLVRNFPEWMSGAVDIRTYAGLHNILPLLRISGTSKAIFFFVIGIVDFIFIFKVRVAFGESNMNKGQKGTARFATLSEIKEQYKEVPAKEEKYPGRGGMLISRYKDKCYIETDPVHGLFLGITRAGKDEMFLRPMIEINSRAVDAPSMLIVDLKLENYKSTSLLLKERGYDTYLINIAFPKYSDGIQLLDKVIERIREGDIDEAEALCTQIADILFREENSVQSENSRYFKNNATNLLRAMIFAQTEDCLKQDEEMDRKCRLKWEEKQKEYVLYSEERQMQIDVQFEFEKKRFFSTHTPEYHTGEWQSYVLKKMKQIPAYEEYKPCMDNVRKVTFYSILYTFSTLAETVVDQKTGRTKLDVYFGKRPVNDKARKYFSSIKIAGSDKTKGNIYSTMLSDLQIFMRNDIGALTSESSFNIDDIGFGERPVAVYLGMPEYDQTKNSIISIFMTQVYYELSRRCALGKGVCDRDVFIFFNEAGNCPAIPNLPTELTTSAGRRIYWYFFIQELQQLKDLYRDNYKTLFSNCGNKVYIKSGDQETNKEFAELIGNETVTNVQRNGKKMSLDKSLFEHFEEKPLMNANQLMQEMLVGENIIVRIMHPYDNKGNPIKQYPIYNRYENGTQFIPAHKYLSDIIPDHREIDFLQMVTCSREHIDLKDTLVDVEKIGSEGGKVPVVLEDLSTYQALMRAVADILGEDFLCEKEINGDMRIQAFLDILHRSQVERFQAQAILTILESGGA
ncbi:type IV secretory system conjugative DNA transfer family protein [Roseburia hominis]